MKFFPCCADHALSLQSASKNCQARRQSEVFPKPWAISGERAGALIRLVVEKFLCIAAGHA